MVASTTYYADNTADGYAESNTTGDNYSPDSATGTSTGFEWLRVGQQYATGQYILAQGFWVFDLTNPTSGSAISAGATINSATLSLWCVANGSYGHTWNMELAKFDWTSGGLTTGDWRTTAQITSLYGTAGSGLFASLADVAANFTETAYTAFTSGAHLVADIGASIGGSLPLVAWSDRLRSNTHPTSAEYCYVGTADDATQGHHPKLVVDWTAAAPTVTNVSPNSGSVAGGTSVTITGTGFTGASAVHFGTASQPTFTVVSDTQITCNSPAGSG